MIKWRNLVGPEYACYVFPNLKNPVDHFKSVKKAWATALKAAKLLYFPIYNLRATFASRLSATGTPDVFVAQMMGHSSPSILQTYAKLIDEYRDDAIRKLEPFRRSSTARMHEGPNELAELTSLGKVQ